MGDIITITGSGFDPVRGNDCVVLKNGARTIPMRVVQASSNGFFPAGRRFAVLASSLGLARAAAFGVLGFAPLLTMIGPVCRLLGWAGAMDRLSGNVETCPA